jgi:diguanylate cyclase (GGDEF)-like protein
MRQEFAMTASSERCSAGGTGKLGSAATPVIDESTLKSSGLFGGQICKVPMLTFLSGEALGKDLPLVQHQVTIGRGEESDLLIMDPSVSRRHVRLTCRKIIDKGKGEDIRVVLEDLASKNGTLVNYQRVHKAVLKSGDKICLGRVILRFEYRDLADQSFFNEIYRLATTDGLTLLLNKATILRELTHEVTKRLRYHRPLSLVVLDVDNFKSLNDTFGHLMGDRALQVIAEILRQNLRRQDKAGRFGGEEFLIVLPETGAKGAIALAERIRQDLQKSLAEKLSLPRKVTASFGVACCNANCRDTESLISNADAALYRAKARGKNRVEIWNNKRQKTSGS